MKNLKPIALGNTTTESLPFENVNYPKHYGTFIAFSEKIDDFPSLCSCSIPAIENFFKLNLDRERNTFSNPLRMAPLSTLYFPERIAEYSLSDAFRGISSLVFNNSICHRCCMSVPSLRYCHEMYGTRFVQNFGWYINQAYLKYGVDRRTLNILSEYCPDDLQELISEYNPLKENSSQILRTINNYVEDSVREEFGMRKIGEYWVSESILFQIIKKLFPHSIIFRHHRPEWLERLELDVYVSDLNLAFEYQGQQHFKAIKAWGGEKALIDLKERDKRKAMICKEKGIKLIYINYYEPLTEDYVLEKVRNK